MRDDFKKQFEKFTQEEKMSMMRNMCQSMMPGMFGTETPQDSDFANDEIKSLFEDWVNQVREEIERYKHEKPAATNAEIARYLKISEKSLAYFINDSEKNDYETIKLEKTKNICPMCENYAKEQAEKPVVVMSCEGACLRGEISRRAANHICHDLLPDKTVRLCLGGAFTKDGGQRNLVKNAPKVLALEGCFIKCASRMMKGVVDDMDPEIIVTDNLFEFNTDLFGINEMPEEEIEKNARIVAEKIAETIR